MKLLKIYISTLKTMYLIHQQNHWKCAGPNFYGNHLLFQRLYESVQKNLDQAAEKFISLFGNDILDLGAEIEIINKIVKASIREKSFEMSLKIEEDFLIVNSELISELKKSGKLTPGLEDMLTAQAGMAEERVYLLKQAYK